MTTAAMTMIPLTVVQEIAHVVVLNHLYKDPLQLYPQWHDC